jgi:hypothetical protein
MPGVKDAVLETWKVSFEFDRVTSGDAKETASRF